MSGSNFVNYFWDTILEMVSYVREPRQPAGQVAIGHWMGF
jgi:hypothetical protein